jgi:hypothetical protein
MMVEFVELIIIVTQFYHIHCKKFGKEGKNENEREEMYG